MEIRKFVHNVRITSAGIVNRYYTLKFGLPALALLAAVIAGATFFKVSAQREPIVLTELQRLRVENARLRGETALAAAQKFNEQINSANAEIVAILTDALRSAGVDKSKLSEYEYNRDTGVLTPKVTPSPSPSP